jgi:class 3 adenylate cyclase
MTASVQQLRKIVSDSLRRAEQAAIQMRLDARDENEKIAKAMVKDLPRFRNFTLGDGATAWGAILFVDLRNSTKRAKSIGPRKTYLTMHALLPALAYAVDQYGGYTVGFRGDGLFAVFGMNEHGRNPDGQSQGRVIVDACSCGQFMIEAVAKVVNPALEERECAGNLHIGIGIDSGTIVITRIGFLFADEVTAYGDAVNSAAKISDISDNTVIVSEEVDQLFPTSEGGRVKAKVVEGYPAYREIVFPSALLAA